MNGSAFFDTAGNPTEVLGQALLLLGMDNPKASKRLVQESCRKRLEEPIFKGSIARRYLASFKPLLADLGLLQPVKLPINVLPHFDACLYFEPNESSASLLQENFLRMQYEVYRVRCSEMYRLQETANLIPLGGPFEGLIQRAIAPEEKNSFQNLISAWVQSGCTAQKVMVVCTGQPYVLRDTLILRKLMPPNVQYYIVGRGTTVTDNLEQLIAGLLSTIILL